MIKDWQYKQYKRELNKVEQIPKGWGGRKQNDVDDDIVKDLLYKTYKYDDLLCKLEELNLLDDKQYYIRRWMMILIEKCDRYLFSQSDCVEDNPNCKDQEYDFKIKDVKLDLKSTRISMELIENYTNKKFSDLTNSEYKDAVMHFISNPDELITFLYENQSTGVRCSFHNRLFFATADVRSKVNFYDEFDLRLDFGSKATVIENFIEYFDPNELKTYEVYNFKDNKQQSLNAKVIFLYRDEDGLFYSI